MKNTDVVDLIDEEINKKDKKLEKKIEKERLKELKREEKRKKKLEKEEDSGFDEFLEKIKEEKSIFASSNTVDIDRIPDVPAPIKNNKMDVESKSIKSNHPILNFFVVFFSLGLFVISIDYLVYSVYTNYVNITTMVINCILVSTVIFYLLSILVKKESIKKFFEVLSLILFICYMGYYLFII